MGKKKKNRGLVENRFVTVLYTEGVQRATRFYTNRGGERSRVEKKEGIVQSAISRGHDNEEKKASPSQGVQGNEGGGGARKEGPFRSIGVLLWRAFGV